MSMTNKRWRAIGGVATVVTVVVAAAVVASGAESTEETVFITVVPCRLIDTRAGDSNVGPRSTPIDENAPVSFTAWDSGDADSTCEIPSSATAISTNTTIVNPTAASFLSLYPSDAAQRPNASNLNYVAGQVPTPNSVTAPLSADGRFNVFNRFGTVDVIIDVNGYFQPSANGGAAGPIGPAGPGPPAQPVRTGPIGPAGPIGPDGIVSLHPLAGSIGVIAANSATYGFIGQTASITIEANQRLFGGGSAALAATSGTAQFRLGLCFQPGAGALVNFTGNYMEAQADTLRASQSVMAAGPALPAGDYTVGMCVRNSGAVALDDNDFMNAWIAVTN